MQKLHHFRCETAFFLVQSKKLKCFLIFAETPMQTKNIVCPNALCGPGAPFFLVVQFFDVSEITGIYIAFLIYCVQCTLYFVGQVLIVYFTVNLCTQ